MLETSALSRRKFVSAGSGMAALSSPLVVPLSASAATQTVSKISKSKRPPMTKDELEALPLPDLPGWALAVASDARLLDVYVYAITKPSGVPLFAIDLDDQDRIRSVGYFFETEAEAEAQRRSVKAACNPEVAGDAIVLPVPIAEALALTYQPVSKRSGFPGYYCHRFYLAPEVKADALKLTGIDRLPDVAVPLFYENADGSLFLRLSDLLEDRKKGSGGRRSEMERPKGTTEDDPIDGPDVRVADLAKVAKAWAAAAAASEKNTASGAPGSGRVVGAGKGKGRSTSPFAINYSRDQATLALEWNI